MKGAVLIIGSLLWENEINAINKKQGKRRSEWRKNLDLTAKIPINVPIRYGRKSSSRRCTYTMIFSNSAELGKAYLVPYLKETSNLEEVRNQALELALAEGISNMNNKYRLYTTWGAVGITFLNNKRKELNEIIQDWHKEFEQLEDTNSYKLGNEEPAILNNGELNFNIEIPENIDYTFATPVVPNVNEYPSVEKITNAILESKPKYDTYLIQNYKKGIRVKDDNLMIEKLK